MRWPVANVAVTTVDRATHQDNAFQLAESIAIFLDGGANVHERPDGNQRYFPRVAPNLFQQKGDCIRMQSLCEVPPFGVAELGESGLARRRRASGYGDSRAAHFTPQPV